jgi:ABC-2 type transport system permease protein
MRWRAIIAIARKDLSIATRSRGVRLPILLAPVVVLGLIPPLLVGAGWLISLRNLADQGLVTPATPQEQAWAMAIIDAEPWVAFVLESLLAPLFVLVPLVVAIVIAADSFAGERERGTLEALLHSPATDEELLTGKFLSSWIPAVTVALGGFILYTGVASLLVAPYQSLSFPPPAWVLLALWVAPAVAGLGLGLMVVISSRVDSLQAAHQLGALVIVPVMVLLIVQLVAAVEISARLVMAVGGAVWAVVGLLVIVAERRFRRDRLAARL